MIKLKNILLEAYTDSNEYITNSDIMNGKIKNIKGLELDYDPITKTINWYNYDNDKVVYATPNWNGKAGIVDFSDDDGTNFKKLNFSKGKYKGNKQLQLKLYYEAVKKAIERISK